MDPEQKLWQTVAQERQDVCDNLHGTQAQAHQGVQRVAAKCPKVVEDNRLFGHIVALCNCKVDIVLEVFEESAN